MQIVILKTIADIQVAKTLRAALMVERKAWPQKRSDCDDTVGIRIATLNSPLATGHVSHERLKEGGVKGSTRLV